MNVGLRSIGTAELALRASNRPGAWFVLIVADVLAVREAVRELVTELGYLSEQEVSSLETQSAPEALAAAFEQCPPGVVVTHGFESFSSQTWQDMDLLRSRYRRDASVIMVMTLASMDLLMQNAPNLASWIGNAWQWDEHAHELSNPEREQRLQALREQFGLSDQEVIAQAEQGQLPMDPEYAEWLVLLGKGALLDHE